MYIAKVAELFILPKFRFFMLNTIPTLIFRKPRLGLAKKKDAYIVQKIKNEQIYFLDDYLSVIEAIINHSLFCY